VSAWSEARAELELTERPVQPQATPGEKPPIDLEAAKPRFGGDMTFFVELLGEFMGQIEERCQGMHAALESQDAPELARLAHNLKGAAANFSAENLAAAAKDLEVQAKNGDLTGAPELLACVEAEIPRLERFYAQMVESTRL
jgi:HPt (histidine-containing phosphotransfer) domain-containing protein